MSAELKPCPFCGGEAGIIKGYVEDEGGEMIWCKCRSCSAQTMYFPRRRKIKAIAAWNRRAFPWVPAGERLPGPDFVGGLVFTTIPPDELHFGEWCDPVDWGDESGFCCRHESCEGKTYKVSEVSYWAPEPPLPEPPGREGE